MYLAKHLTEASLPEIGRQFGGKHHTTVLHSIEKIDKQKQLDKDLNRTLNKLPCGGADCLRRVRASKKGWDQDSCWLTCNGDRRVSKSAKNKSPCRGLRRGLLRFPSQLSQTQHVAVGIVKPSDARTAGGCPDAERVVVVQRWIA
jgi:hypothetical protein